MSLFQISTSNSHVGGAQRCHILYCNESVKETIDGFEHDKYSVGVEVRVNFGDKEGPYKFQPFVYYHGERIELIDGAEWSRRRRIAEEYGVVYDDSSVLVDTMHDEFAYKATRIANETIEKFKALIALDIFSLPVTF